MGYVIWAIIFFIIYKTYQRNIYYKTLKKIPIRIHVNGSRGKSDVSRLIGAGLRSSKELKVCVKTTGTIPTIIGMNGEEIPIIRRTPVNIGEQMKIVKRAAKAGVDVLVLECMAVQPELQWISENKMIQSQVGVITNARLDHLDVMGENSNEIAQNLGLTIPQDGKVFTADCEHAHIFSKVAKERRSECILVRSDEMDEQLWDGVSREFFKENVAVALAVCEELGVPSHQAIHGMLEYTPDLGAFRIYTLIVGKKQIYFANAFSANDPESTLILLKKSLAEVNPKKIIGLYNRRKDRDFRTSLFLDLMEEISFDQVLWFDRKIPSRLKKKLNGSVQAIHDPEEMICYLKSLPHQSLVFGFGNFKDKGAKLIEVIKEEVRGQ